MVGISISINIHHTYLYLLLLDTSLCISKNLLVKNFILSSLTRHYPTQPWSQQQQQPTQSVTQTIRTVVQPRIALRWYPRLALSLNTAHSISPKTTATTQEQQSTKSDEYIFFKATNCLHQSVIRNAIMRIQLLNVKLKSIPPKCAVNTNYDHWLGHLISTRRPSVRQQS